MPSSARTDKKERKTSSLLYAIILALLLNAFFLMLFRPVNAPEKHTKEPTKQTRTVKCFMVDLKNNGSAVEERTAAYALIDDPTVMALPHPELHRGEKSTHPKKHKFFQDLNEYNIDLTTPSETSTMRELNLSEFNPAPNLTNMKTPSFSDWATPYMSAKIIHQKKLPGTILWRQENGTAIVPAPAFTATEKNQIATIIEAKTFTQISNPSTLTIQSSTSAQPRIMVARSCGLPRLDLIGKRAAARWATTNKKNAMLKNQEIEIEWRLKK